VAVVTDNQGILGIGDQGAGGIAICVGKLMLYTQGAGIAPWHCLPVSLDVGTNNEALLNDDEYLGWRHRRLSGEEYIHFVQRFARAFRNVFPNALCQWEDFSKQNAFAIRDAYLHDLISFNDDIQGTGAVALAGILTAMKIKQERLRDQVFLIHGAGAGGVGIAEQIETALHEEGLTVAEARARIFTLDSRGLILADKDLLPYKQKFAKDPAVLPWIEDDKDLQLENVVRNAGVTVLVGTSGQSGCFTEKIVRSMLEHTDRPVIMPLSNPTSMAEAVPADLYKWTNGRALVGTGSPFPPLHTTARSTASDSATMSSCSRGRSGRSRFRGQGSPARVFYRRRPRRIRICHGQGDAVRHTDARCHHPERGESQGGAGRGRNSDTEGRQQTFRFLIVQAQRRTRAIE
jgi:malate dehydrogenase (oxaloacetate-decarboxylating)